MKIHLLFLLAVVATAAAARDDTNGMGLSNYGKKGSPLNHARVSGRSLRGKSKSKNVFAAARTTKGMSKSKNKNEDNTAKTANVASSRSKQSKSKGRPSANKVNSNVVDVPTDPPTDSTVPPSQTQGDVITEPPVSSTSLAADMTGPGAAFANQEVVFTVLVTNVGTDVEAMNVVLEIKLPSEGSFVGSDPEGTVSGNMLSVDLDNLAPGASREVELRWQAPDNEVTLISRATATANNANDVTDDEEVQVGATSSVTGGVASAGIGLRDVSGGTISVTEIPSGASVTRAVLVWALLYNSPTPSNQITFEGQSVTADLTATISQSLCWGDENTIGYATDVTSLVKGNGDYVLADVINGDSGVLPFTDGASLFIFYGGPGIDDQVISDFTYSAANGSQSNERTLTGITSTGGTATLHLAGPDGQSFGEEVRVTGNGELNFDDSWDGSAPGGLWDNDIHDVSSILPAGQATVDIRLTPTGDCVGLSAVALQVEQ